jgi:hypothetical protein
MMILWIEQQNHRQEQDQSQQNQMLKQKNSQIPDLKPQNQKQAFQCDQPQQKQNHQK